MKKISVKVLAFAGMLIAMNVVLTRIVAIPIGPTLRITVGSVPIMLSSLWFGPLVGAICGGTGDLIGSLLSGYAPNPFILVSSVLTGVLPYCFKHFMIKDLPIKGSKGEVFGKGLVKIMMIIGSMSLITSQGFTTYGLSLLQGIPFWALFVTRLPQSIFLTIVNSILVLLLYTSPVTIFIQNNMEDIRKAPKRI